ncbi:MAG: hypothetical protein C0617_06360 [Desulfuromonas sp.]|uniref:hypothetical protein n=1 Tax=Desulfuromonas sp. TaxID=892 RepID=UPI000CB3BA61|nr:hypothetical protein [Desulfuromonas sp.]PLX84832.1 MAG: hypothetical protein C0617_06360 [Desulfuromonas sp.]
MASSQHDEKKQGELGDAEDERLRGVACLFSREELKNFFSSYLILIGVVEGFIFFFSWLSYIWSETGAFPWKAFLIGAFTTPVAITFIFAIIVIGFNKYMFAKAAREEKEMGIAPAEGGKTHSKLDLAFYYMRQVPFLVGLLLLVVSAAFVYKLDAITLFIANAGERAAHYLFVSMAVLVGVSTVVVLVWMALSYHLRKKRLDYLFQYKKEVMERTGMIILDDDSIIDREGRLIEHPGAKEGARGKDEDVRLIPKLPFRKSGG